MPQGRNGVEFTTITTDANFHVRICLETLAATFAPWSLRIILGGERGRGRGRGLKPSTTPSPISNSSLCRPHAHQPHETLLTD